MAYDAVIFDLDDTLLKSVEIKWAHHKEVTRRFYGFELTDEELGEHWGKPFEEMIGPLYRNVDALDVMIAANRSIEAEFLKGIFDDTHETLAAISAAGVAMGIVSSTMHSYLLDDLARHGVSAELFTFIYCADNSTHHKPDPRVFDAPMAHLREQGCDGSVVYVGDALIDHAAAAGADLDFIAVTTGLIKREAFEAVGAKHVVGSVSEILPLVLPGG